ncbi:hypothetical protein Leryth_022385 [Lithospermum erythrorhizon]|nr:hypothetical protein Leryth_022385 [Lithospermum erythrorhizon]
MSEKEGNSSETMGAKCRVIGGTELSWCKAVPGGTGTTVLALLFSKQPQLPLLQYALHKLQTTHPILNSKIHFTPSTSTYSYLISPSPSLQIQSFDPSSTAQIIRNLFIKTPSSSSIAPFHLILEHELNRNSWGDADEIEKEVFFCSLYSLDDEKWVVALRLHTSVCDRTTAATILREMLGIMSTNKLEEEEQRGIGEVGLAVEDYIPSGKANKPFWARGADLLGYSFNGLRFSNLEFKDSVSQRSTQFIRFQLTSQETDGILSACMAKGIKLCALFTAAFFIATRSSKSIPDEQFEKYAVVMLVDCRAVLEPELTDQHCGFYYSAILNTHDVKGGEDLWELTKRTYTSLTNAKNNHKHFTDMADLNFLMCKAIDNPALTPSSSMRTSLISVFEDTPIDSSNQVSNDIGLVDYIGCASVHGVGTSVAIFDTIRNGKLDCACVYPSPLHSREQMQELINEMVKIMIDGSNYN